MASTIVVALRRAVVDGLSGLLPDYGDRQALVTYAWDPEARDSLQVFTMRPRGDHSPAALRAGRNHRNEEASFQVVIHVEVAGADVEEADNRALEIGQVVEEFIADHKSNELAIPGLNWITVSSWEMNGGPADRSAISQLIYTVSYNARLT